MVVAWIVFIIGFIIAELISVGLTSIWFAAGSLVALVIAAAGGPVWLQLVAFIAVSLILLIATRPWAKKYLNSRAQHTNADRVIGTKLIVEERVSNREQTGKATVMGQEWTVRAEEDSEIFEVGETAEIVAISGVKLIIKRV